jgi:hypothetical protein
MTELKITQADRDAANRLMEIWDDGDLHCDDFVEAFARHRIAAEEGKAELVKAAESLAPYLKWMLGPESPGYHPTMPSAVAQFNAALARVRGEG